MKALTSDVLWPAERTGEAVAVLARASRLNSEASPTSAGYGVAGLEAAAARLELETEIRVASYEKVEEILATLGPALIEIQAPNAFLVVLRRGRRRYVLGPDHRLRRCSSEELRSFLCSNLESELRDSFNEILAVAAVSEARREPSLRRWFQRSLAGRPTFRAWELSPAVGSPALRQLRHGRMFRPLAALTAAHVVEQVAVVTAWWILGMSVLSGHLDSGWLWAWALLLLMTIPVRAWGAWAQGVFSLGAGALLKRRLIAGALRLEPEQVRRDGAGRNLGRVIESETVETLALHGGFTTLLCLVDLATAAFVLALGVAPKMHLSILLAWMLVACVASLRFLSVHRSLTSVRIGMTHRLVEHLVGQRTRLVQEHPQRLHDDEDLDLRAHLEHSVALDRWLPRLGTLLPRGWLLLALAVMIPALMDPALTTAGAAVSLGGILLATRGLQSLSAGLGTLAGTKVAWEQIRDLYEAAEKTPAPGSPALLAEAEKRELPPLVLHSEAVGFAYPGYGRSVLEGVDLQLHRGDQVLLEGASGGGKSTLVSLLAGLRTPNEGRLSIHGAGVEAWGQNGWSRWVVCAPQFHENHLFVGPLAFNLLLGREWPPSLQTLEEAEEVCRRVGLGDLLDRMPGGIMQAVGESGWRLSHGERSRVYLARALLQGPELILLDESFAALDAGSFLTALEHARASAPALLVVAHPPRAL